MNDDDEENKCFFHAVYKSHLRMVIPIKSYELDRFDKQMREHRSKGPYYLPILLEMSKDEVIEQHKTDVLNTSFIAEKRFLAIMGLVYLNVPGAHCGYVVPCVRPRSKNALCCVCGEKATGRCSGCEMTFYCGEDHQLENHDAHKCFCRLSIKRDRLNGWMCLSDKPM